VPRIEIGAVTYWVLLVTFFCITPLGCSRQGGKGVLEVRIKDHRDAIDDFSQARVIIESIRLSPKVGIKFWQLGWIKLNPSLDQVDLTKFVHNTAATIFKGELDAGSFEGFDLKVRDVQGMLKRDGNESPIKNVLTPIALPFSVHPGEVTLIVLDLSVVDMSDHPPEAYELQLEGYEVFNNGKLVDKIPPG
jgi:Domain of unknown function (DUF4382)